MSAHHQLVLTTPKGEGSSAFPPSPLLFHVLTTMINDNGSEVSNEQAPPLLLGQCNASKCLIPN
ncbi:MAG: hypothetical protein LDL41_18005, partial [Coleofasciculus sp. S288]|nr:hypothetical protein [Coleofasciculus sp. S288]